MSFFNYGLGNETQGKCYGLLSVTFPIGGGREVQLFSTIVAALLFLSCFVLLWLLAYRYKKALAGQVVRAPFIVLPIYNIAIIGAAVLFFLQGISLFLPPGLGYVVIIQSILFALQTGVADSWLFVWLLTRPTGRAKLLTFLAIFITFSACLVFQIIYVYLPMEPDICEWCSLFIPSAHTFWLQVGFIGVFLLLLLSTLPFIHCGEHRTRPALKIWGSFIVVTYFISNSGLFTLLKWSNDAGYCVMGSGFILYTLFYAPVMFFTFTRDTEYCLRNNLLKPGPPQEQTQYQYLAGVPPSFQDLVLDADVKIIEKGTLQIKERIGRGGSADVYRAEWSGMDVAVKQFSLEIFAAQSDSELKQLVSEIKIMSKQRHPNIAVFLGVAIDDDYIGIVSEYIARGSLYSVLHVQKIQLGWKAVDRIFKGIIKAMFYLHNASPKVLHRDLKSSNVLIDSQWNAKLIDFGLSRTLEGLSGAISPVGTVQWAAPELLSGQKYSTEADVYSAGVILWELLTGDQPFKNLPPGQVAVFVADGSLALKIPKYLPPHVADLLRMMISRDPLSRPSFASIQQRLEHINMAEFSPDLPEIRKPGSVPIRTNSPAKSTPPIAALTPINEDQDDSNPHI